MKEVNEFFKLSKVQDKSNENLDLKFILWAYFLQRNFK